MPISYSHRCGLAYRGVAFRRPLSMVSRVHPMVFLWTTLPVYKVMEALIINHNFKANVSLKEVMSTFFRTNDPETTKVLFWKFFQCWVTKDCHIKADLSDEEVALFFD